MKPTKKKTNGKPAKAQICLRVNGEPVEVMTTINVDFRLD